MLPVEAKQELMLKLIEATAGEYGVEELIELYFFMTTPDEDEKPTLTVLEKKQ